MENRMNKQEYEEKISELAGRLEDLITNIDNLRDEAKRLIRFVEDIPDLSDLDPEEKDED